MKMVVELMEMAPGAITHPGRVPKQRLSVPRISFVMVAALWNSSWNIDRVFRVFTSGEINKRRGDARRWPRWAHHAQAWPSLARAWDGCGHPLVPLRLSFWLPGSSGIIEFL